MKTVSAVIPNYNGKSLLQKFLPFVLKTLTNGDELIIVDDNSTDESVSFLIREYKLKLTKKTVLAHKASKEYYPQEKDISYKLYSNSVLVGKNRVAILLVALEKNMRFAAAANTGVLFSSGECILLLNSDVKPEKNVRTELVQHFTDPLVFGVGCLEYEKDENGEKSGKNKLWFEKGMFMHSKAEDMFSGESAWVSGGSGMFDTEKWFYLNGFDKSYYPAYWEDVDLSFRAKMQGWKVLFDQNAVVYHVHESTNIDVFGQQKIMDMSWKNSVTFIKNNANMWQLICFYLFKPYWAYKRRKQLENKIKL